MYATKNDLPANTRQSVTEALARLLPDAIDLYAQTKQAHWNVKGSDFMMLHELFDKIASEVSEAVDMIAERIVQLGGEARGNIRQVAKESRMAEYPLLAAEGPAHADALSNAIAAFNASARAAIDETDDLGDAVTADMLTGITRGLDKQLWFVEAHVSK